MNVRGVRFGEQLPHIQLDKRRGVGSQTKVQVLTTRSATLLSWVEYCGGALLCARQIASTHIADRLVAGSGPPKRLTVQAPCGSLALCLIVSNLCVMEGFWVYVNGCETEC